MADASTLDGLLKISKSVESLAQELAGLPGLAEDDQEELCLFGLRVVLEILMNVSESFSSNRDLFAVCSDGPVRLRTAYPSAHEAVVSVAKSLCNQLWSQVQSESLIKSTGDLRKIRIDPGMMLGDWLETKEIILDWLEPLKFQLIDLQSRIPKERFLLSKRPENHEADSKTSEFIQFPPINEEDVFILQALRGKHPQLLTQEQIENEIRRRNKVGISLRTIQNKIPRLLELNLITKPLKPLKGYGITETGFEIIPKS